MLMRVKFLLGLFLSFCKGNKRINSFRCFLFFSRKKEKQKKLAAASKSAKISLFTLDKNELASLRQHFCLNRFNNEISSRYLAKAAF
jgi:hypothetical protein